MSDPNSPSGDTAREKRLARNEAFFREANELTAERRTQLASRPSFSASAPHSAASTA